MSSIGVASPPPPFGVPFSFRSASASPFPSSAASSSPAILSSSPAECLLSPTASSCPSFRPISAFILSWYSGDIIRLQVCTCNWGHFYADEMVYFAAFSSEDSVQNDSGHLINDCVGPPPSLVPCLMPQPEWLTFPSTPAARSLLPQPLP